jgi:D-alanine transaminase/branched-chain amino acid aminotransferase
MLQYILNHKLVNENEARVHVSDLALLRAYGIFDFFRTRGLGPLFLDDHLDRFYRSASVLRLECPLSRHELKTLIFEMLEANNIQNSGVRLVLTGGESPNGYVPGKPTFFAINEPINPLPEWHFTKGIKLISCAYLRDIPEIKSTNYMVGIYKLPELARYHAEDLLYHWENRVSEVTKSNFFIVNRAGEIITAKHNILKGITRKHIIKLAEGTFKVYERDVFLDEVYAAEEAFITGTTKKVTPVVDIDGRKIGTGKPGAVTKELMKRFEEFVARQT